MLGFRVPNDDVEVVAQRDDERRVARPKVQPRQHQRLRLGCFLFYWHVFGPCFLKWDVFWGRDVSSLCVLDVL